MADQKKKYGFKDARTAAELALAPGKPASRSAPVVSNLKFSGKLGAVATAATLSSAAFSSIRASLNAKKSLVTLQASMTTSLQQFDTQKSALLSGQTSLRDVGVFGLTSVSTVQNGGFFAAADLVQMSGVAPGLALAGAAGITALLTQRRRKLANMTTRISVALAGFSIASALIKENYNRTPNPQEEELDAPSIPRLAQGDEAAQKDPALKDKRRFTVKGVVAAAGKPSIWARLTTSWTDPIKGYRLQPGFNAALNMVFADKKHQTTWSEPSTPYAAQHPYNKVTQTESGHLVEYDDTPGAERIHFFHRSGSFIEMHPDGKVVYKSMNDGFIISMADQNIKVKGKCNISVDGDANIYAKGEMNLQSDSDINVQTKKDFNVYATNVNLRAKKNAKLDGLTVDLRYAKLPGVPVFTMSGPAVRLNPAALAKDFPELNFQMEQQQRLWMNTMNTLEKEITKSPSHLKDADAASRVVVAGPYPVKGVDTVVEHLGRAHKATLSIIRLLKSGPYPKADVHDVRNNSILLDQNTAAEFIFPPLDPEMEPLDNPLGNPLAYITTTPAAVNYRTLFFDTPEEMGDAEQYQAHLETRQQLGDISSVEPQLGGKRTTPDTGITAPASLPLVNYLDRDTYRGNFSADPGQTLGGTSFTYGELVDSLSRPDVANPVVTKTPTA